jgi:hypothetical protein
MFDGSVLMSQGGGNSFSFALCYKADESADESKK